MVWSSVTPPTAGTPVPTSTFGTPVATDLDILGGPYTADARASSAIWTAATTNPVLGNGTLVSRYRLAGIPGSGGTLDWELVLTGGSSTSWGSGQFFFAYPGGASPKTGGLFVPVTLNDASGSVMLGAGAVTGGSVNIRSITTAAGVLSPVTATAPITWAVNDVIGFRLSCEVA